MPTMSEIIQRYSNANTAISQAITAKGGTVNSGDGFEDFATDIGTIQTGSTIQTDGVVIRLSETPIGQTPLFIIGYNIYITKLKYGEILQPYNANMVIASHSTISSGIQGTTYVVYPTVPLSIYLTQNETITVKGNTTNGTQYTQTWDLDITNNEVTITQASSTDNINAAWIGSKPIVANWIGW